MPWDEIELAGDDLSLVVNYRRSVVQALHHVDVDERDDHVVVTLHLGLSHEAFDTRRQHDGELWYPSAGVKESTEIHLLHELRGRALVDGASPAGT